MIILFLLFCAPPYCGKRGERLPIVDPMAAVILTLTHLLQYNRSQYQLLAGACSEVLLLSAQSKPLDREFRIGRLDRLNRIVMWMLFYCVRTDREFTSFVGFLSTPLLLILWRLWRCYCCCCWFNIAFYVLLALFAFPNFEIHSQILLITMTKQKFNQ